MVGWSDARIGWCGSDDVVVRPPKLVFVAAGWRAEGSRATIAAHLLVKKPPKNKFS